MRSKPLKKGNPFLADLVAGAEGLLLAGSPEAIARRAGLTPDPWQQRVLASTAQTLLINCSRQAGKSTIVALLVVAELLRPERTVLIVSPSDRQSKELYRKVLTFWRRLGRPMGHVIVNRTSLELVNGSRLVALPGKPDTIVGFTPHLIVADEASRISDELFDAFSPMLAVSQGRLIAPSTPKGKRGWWYQLYIMSREEDPEIERVEVKATEISRISAKFLNREKRRLGNMIYLQEYDCQFLDDERQAFATEDIMAAQVEGLVEWSWALAGVGAP